MFGIKLFLYVILLAALIMWYSQSKIYQRLVDYSAGTSFMPEHTLGAAMILALSVVFWGWWGILVTYLIYTYINLN